MTQAMSQQPNLEVWARRLQQMKGCKTVQAW